MGENEAGSAANDIEDLARSMEAPMSQDRFMSPNCCIFKTPTMLRALNEKAYVPYAFSIGPFHHGRPEFKDTEKIKSEYFDGLFSRSGLRSRDTIVRNLLNSVKSVESQARECYSESIGYDSKKFVKILVIDGCFIIELLRKMFVGQSEADDPIFAMACLPAALFHDLILLENQVPWMVLERLFGHIGNNVRATLIDLVKSFYARFLIVPPSGHHPIQEIKHIVDVGRTLLVSPIAGEVGHEGPDWTLLPSATSLVEAGVKIKSFKRGESRSILDLKYDNGVLKIPELVIDERTETLFRNIISFEQCYPNCKPRFTSYAILLDNLINTAKDVDILRENKIIKNWLNPEDVITFFNNLYYNTCVKEIYYQSLCKEVNEYCNRRWPKWHATLVRNYFNTPWAILSTVAAVILLILTFVQTWYAIP